LLSKVLAESEQIRREADNIGPRAELDYWKKRMTKFNFLLDQIKGQDVKAVLTILQTAKSKLIQVKYPKYFLPSRSLFFFL
jgi:dynein heavy chain